MAMLSHMDRYTRSVLIVEHDPTERERLASTLEADGFQVLLCSGPTEPDYTCIGSRSGTCPLATEEAVVVLDMSLDSELVMMGTPAEELLEMYLGLGHPVLALGSRPGEEMPGRLLRRRRHPEAADLTHAVWRLASPRASGRALTSERDLRL
jgi:CheY-like chemotaxis protein